MAIQPSDEAELRRAYLNVIKRASDRSKAFLKATKDRGYRPIRNPERILSVCVDGVEVYRQDLGTGRVKAQRYMPERAQKLQTAIDRPEFLAGKVSIVCGRQPLYVNINGWIQVDALQITHNPERIPYQETVRALKARLVRLEREPIAARKLLPQVWAAPSFEQFAATRSLRSTTRSIAGRTAWVPVLLLAAIALGISFMFSLKSADKPILQAERAQMQARARAEEARKVEGIARPRPEELRKAAESRQQLHAISVDAATSLVENVYYWLSVKNFENAMSLYGPQLKEVSSPAFFNQFSRVTVENLRSVSQTNDSIHLRGENTYVYPDGSTQREARSYTVGNLDGQLKLVSSEFIEVIQFRR